MWGRRRLFALVAGGAVLAIALGVGTALLIGRGGVDGPLDIPRIADPYPTPPRFTMPENCGVRSATLDEVMPHHELANRMENGCYFRTDRIRENARHGSATITFTVGSLRDKGKASVADAMSTFDVTIDRLGLGPGDDAAWQAVSGLGDEAAVRYDHGHKHSEVALRVGAVTAHVTYVIRRAVGSESVPLDEKPSIDGALAIAGDVARALGGKVDSPAVGVKPGSAPALTAPDACGLITPATLRKLGRETAPSKGENPGILDALAETDQDRCYWEERASRTEWTSLSVTVSTFSDDTRGSGEQKAERSFLKTYYEAREGSAGVFLVAPQSFHPLSAPGEQAVAYYSVGSPRSGIQKYAEGVVVFRIRNLVVRVSYDGLSGGEPIPEAAALNRAYLGAKDAAAALAG